MISKHQVTLLLFCSYCSSTFWQSCGKLATVDKRKSYAANGGEPNNGDSTSGSDVSGESSNSINSKTDPSTSQKSQITPAQALLAKKTGGVLSGPRLELIAGSVSVPSFQNGPLAQAKFSGPGGIINDGNGNLYVVDGAAIRKIGVDGVVSTFAGSFTEIGSVDGVGEKARFFRPGSLAIDEKGNIYVPDYGNSNIRKIDSKGNVTTLAGLAGTPGSVDGTGTAARFQRPIGIVVDAAGVLFVSDPTDGTIRKISSTGQVTTFAGTSALHSHLDGNGINARFVSPDHVAMGKGGDLFVADSGDYTIRKITPAGDVTTFAGMPGIASNTDGPGSTATFYRPSAIAVGPSGDIFVLDFTLNTMRKILQTGEVSTVAGKPGSPGGYSNGNGLNALFNFPADLTIDKNGNIYISDNRNLVIRKVTSNMDVTTLAGDPVVAGFKDGTSDVALLQSPAGIIADPLGNILFLQSAEGALRKMDAKGNITTVVGGPKASKVSTDGAAGIGSLSYPTRMVTDKDGNIYVSESEVTGINIRKLDKSGNLSTIIRMPHNPVARTTGIPSNIQQLEAGGLVVSPDGVIYFANYYSGTIRQILPGTTDFTVFAGSGTTGGQHRLRDGDGRIATFSSPNDITMDSAGNLYIVESEDGAIRKISPAGIVSTLAGAAGRFGSTDGKGSLASFSRKIGGITCDEVGNLYLADTGNNTIRKISQDGTVSTVLGDPARNDFVAGKLPGVISAPVSLVKVGKILYVTMINGIVAAHEIP